MKFTISKKWMADKAAIENGQNIEAGSAPDSLEVLEAALQYERAPGVHTYHACPCGRNPTRAGRCWKCLTEYIANL